MLRTYWMIREVVSSLPPLSCYVVEFVGKKIELSNDKRDERPKTVNDLRSAIHDYFIVKFSCLSIDISIHLRGINFTRMIEKNAHFFSGNTSILVFSTFHFYEVCIVWIWCFRFSVVIKIVWRFRFQLLMLFHLMRCAQCSLVVAADVFDAICDDCKYIFGFVYWWASRVWLIKPKKILTLMSPYIVLGFKMIFFFFFHFSSTTIKFLWFELRYWSWNERTKYFTVNSYRCEK